MTSTVFTEGPHLAAGASVSGSVVLATLACWAMALMAVRLRQPRSDRPGRGRRSWPGTARSSRMTRDPSLDGVVDRLSWGRVSPRHFDLSTRPLLCRVAAALLDERCNVELSGEGERARDILGEEAFWVVDPDRPLSGDSRGAGPPEALVDQLLRRLEAL
jgi:hypothetical protein